MLDAHFIYECEYDWNPQQKRDKNVPFLSFCSRCRCTKISKYQGKVGWWSLHTLLHLVSDWSRNVNVRYNPWRAKIYEKLFIGCLKQHKSRGGLSVSEKGTLTWFHSISLSLSLSPFWYRSLSWFYSCWDSSLALRQCKQNFIQLVGSWCRERIELSLNPRKYFHFKTHQKEFYSRVNSSTVNFKIIFQRIMD